MFSTKNLKRDQKILLKKLRVNVNVKVNVWFKEFTGAAPPARGAEESLVTQAWRVSSRAVERPSF